MKDKEEKGYPVCQTGRWTALGCINNAPFVNHFPSSDRSGVSGLLSLSYSPTMTPRPDPKPSQITPHLHKICTKELEQPMLQRGWTSKTLHERSQTLKTPILHGSIYRKRAEQINPDRESRLVVASGWGQQGNGSDCFKGMEVLLGWCKNSIVLTVAEREKESSESYTFNEWVARYVNYISINLSY